METVQKWKYSVLLFEVFSAFEESQDHATKSRASLLGYGSANIINGREVNHQDLPPDLARNFYRYYFQTFGNQGWELVNATDTKDFRANGVVTSKRLYFKRPSVH